MTSTHGESGPSEPSADQRLDSWKEIATYLKRDERTVRRWEAQQGLPVHRHLHTKRASVYAFRSEIDVWWNNGQARLEHEPSVPPATPRWVTLAPVAGAAVLAVVVGASVWPERAPSLDFEARDWVLIADFENQTGGAIADGTVEYALAYALGESRFVNVVPRQRVVDTLGLMRRPPETAVDAAVGREIALRDGGIRAMLTGRVDKLDTTYALTAAIVDPTTGMTVASAREEAAGDSEFLLAVQRLSNRVRERLGEELADIEQSARLEKMTTPSLSALQLFSHGVDLIRQRRADVAEGLLRQAVAEDPDFASGYMHLARAIRNQGGRPLEDYRPYAERAVELSETTSERERNFILGSYYQMVGQDENAVTAYEALLHLYPDHIWGIVGLANTYRQLGRTEEQARLFARWADLLPNSLIPNITAAGDLIMAGDVEAAEAYITRAEALASAEGTEPLQVTRVSFLPVFASWRRGNLEQARSTLQRAVGSGPPPTTPDARDEWFYWATQGYQWLGMLRAAQETALQGLEFGYTWLGREEEEIRGLMRLADLRPKDLVGNLIAAKRIVQSGTDTTLAQPYLQRARALMSSAGEQNARGMPWLTVLPVWEHWLAGDPGQALTELERATQSVTFRNSPARDLWIMEAGYAYLNLGAVQAAEEMFRQFSSEDLRRGGLAEVAWARGDLQAATHQLGGITQNTGFYRAAVWPRFGDSTWALDYKTMLPSLTPRLAESHDKLVRGQVALSRGETATAITLLEESLVGHHPRFRDTSPGIPFMFFFSSESLARAWEQHGDLEKALRVLENASAARRRIYLGQVGPKGMYWLRMEAERARLARKLGRQEEAARIEAELLKLLAHADPDHVILRELKRLS